MAQRFYEPIARIFTNAGAVGVGYKYYFYQTGTTTPVTTYQNAGLTVANTNPVISDANGRFPEIWYSDLSQLKLIVKDSSNNIVDGAGADPVGATDAAVSLNDFDVRPTSYWGLTAGTSTAFTLIANPTISAYANTQTFVIQPHLDCGDSPTLAIDGLSALNWKKYTQQGTKVALKANDLRASQRYFCINDGVDIVCLNPSSLPLLSGSATALTIASGVVTLTNNSSSYVLDTEGAAATDNLDTINGGQDGQIIYLRIANDARNVIVKHNTGNIWNAQYNNNHSLLLDRAIVLDNTTDFVILRYDLTIAKWIICSSSFDNFGNYKFVNGHTYLPNGLIMQWGEEASFHDIFSDYTATITFQIAFPNAVLQAVTGYKASTVSLYNNDVTATYTNLSTTGFTLSMGEFGSGFNSVKGVYWAIGW